MKTKQSGIVDLPEELFLALLQGYATTRKWASILVARQGITLSEYHLLRIVQNEKHTKATTIRKRLSASAPTIAQMIANLEGKQFIKRIQDKHDKRIQHITLTAHGKKVVENTRKKIACATDDLSLSSDLLSSAIRALETISSSLSSSNSSNG